MSADAEVVSVEKFTALKRDHDSVVEKYTALKQSHAKLESSHNGLIDQHKKMHDRLAVIERAGEESRRSSKIDQMAEKYSLAFDREAEAKRCLPSQGSQLTAEQFDERMKTFDEIGEQFQNSPMLPRGVLPDRYTTRAQADVEKYEERLSLEAIKIHDEGLTQGKNLDWDSCAAEAKKRIGSNGHAAAPA